MSEKKNNNKNEQQDLQIVSSSLEEKTKEIAADLLQEEDLEKVKDLTNLFNLNSRKKNVVRVMKMDKLLDKVTDQVVERFEKTPDNFSNEELLKYMQAAENSIDKANKNLNLVDETPAIQLLQNNQVNISLGEEIDRDSRNRILAAVNAFLNNSQENNSQENNSVISVKISELFSMSL